MQCFRELVVGVNKYIVIERGTFGETKITRN